MDFSVFRIRFAEHRHEFGFLFRCAFAEKMFKYWTHSYLGLHTNIAFTPSHVNLDFKQFFIIFVFMEEQTQECIDKQADSLMTKINAAVNKLIAEKKFIEARRILHSIEWKVRGLDKKCGKA